MEKQTRSKQPSAGLELPARQMLTLVLDALPVGLFWKDRESAILGCNQKFADDSGVRHPSDLIGHTNLDFYPAEQAEAYRADDLEVMTTGHAKLGIEESLLLATGETAWVETNKVPMRDEAGTIIGVLGTYRDVTDRRRAINERTRFAVELALANQAALTASLDDLTGLSNRRSLRTSLGDRFIREKEPHLAVVALDLDRFRSINDLYGRSVGDEVLLKVASILLDEVGESGSVARVSGDGFVLLINADSERLNDRLSALATRFAFPLQLSKHEVQVGATIGVATAPAHGVDPEALLSRADLALNSAKEHGGKRVAFFDTAMEFLAQERAALERDLLIAVKTNRIVPYFQPIVELATGIVSSYEVLARWEHAEHGFVPPDKFIRLAEELGLIDELTTGLLGHACREVSKWPGEPHIALNISPIQLRDSALPSKLANVLSVCSFSPRRLEIEITEDAIIADIDDARTILGSLKRLGMRVALDDFGSGYSSLRYLRELSFDVLKLDQSFIRSMVDTEGVAIVKAVLQMAHTLGLVVTAEGIETNRQLDVLLALGCLRGQGFYLGRPLPGLQGASQLNTRPAIQAVAGV